MPVKCADCGFLAVRHTQTRQLMDAESLFRERGYIPALGLHAQSYAYDECPVCFVQATDFRFETSAHLNETTRRDVIQIKRECGKFTPWIQGFTPKEHKEMLDQKLMLEFQQKQADADRAWRDSQAEKEHAWRSGEAQLAAQRHGRELILIGILVPVVTLIVSVMNAFIERGDLFRSKPAEKQPAMDVTD